MALIGRGAWQSTNEVLLPGELLLGLLRDYLADPVKDKIWTEIDKDLTHLSLEKVEVTVKAHLVA